MPVPVIESTASVAHLLEENAFTLARLSQHPATAPIGADLEAFGGSITAIVVADEELDRLVARLEEALLAAASGDKKHELYARYLGTRSRRELERPIVAGRLDVLRAWLPQLVAETDVGLLALSGDLERALLAADGAALAQAGGEKTIRDFRSAGQREALIDQFNILRRLAALKLSDLREAFPDEDLPAPEDCFRVDPRGTLEPGAPIADELRAKIARLREDLGDLEDQLAAIAAHEEAERKLAEAKRTAEETRLRVEALEARRSRG